MVTDENRVYLLLPVDQLSDRLELAVDSVDGQSTAVQHSDEWTTASDSEVDIFVKYSI